MHHLTRAGSSPCACPPEVPDEPQLHTETAAQSTHKGYRWCRVISCRGHRKHGQHQQPGGWYSKTPTRYEYQPFGCWLTLPADLSPQVEQPTTHRCPSLSRSPWIYVLTRHMSINARHGVVDQWIPCPGLGWVSTSLSAPKRRSPAFVAARSASRPTPVSCRQSCIPPDEGSSATATASRSASAAVRSSMISRAMR